MGLDCCSDTTISFHYMSIDDMLKLNLILKYKDNLSLKKFEKVWIEFNDLKNK